MIELLGVGVPRENGGWLLHRVCARLSRGELAAVVSRRPEERLALLDSVTARLIPVEGRVWVGRLPVARETAGRIRLLVGEIDPGARLVERRSPLWNALAAASPGSGMLQRLLHFPRPAERQSALRTLERVGLKAQAHDPVSELDLEGRARLAVALALFRRHEYLVVREVDVALGLAVAEKLMTLLRALARSERISVLASVASLPLARRFADRIIGIADGLLVFDGPPAQFTDDGVAWRFAVPAEALG